MSSRSSYKICDFCGKKGKYLKENQRIYQVGDEAQIARLNLLFSKNCESDVEACSDCYFQARHAPDSNRINTIADSIQINSSTGIDSN